jgi:hypothetical protein
VNTVINIRVPYKEEGALIRWGTVGPQKGLCFMELVGCLDMFLVNIATLLTATLCETQIYQNMTLCRK